MNKLAFHAAAARNKFASVKERGLGRALKEDGAIDLASIMVGVLVIGIVGGVIAATVFAVIPWAQDQAAEQALDSVATAESVAFAQSAGEGAGKYLSTPDLFETDGLGGDDGLLQESDAIYVDVSANGKEYTAYSLSDTGKVFSTTNANPNTAVEVDGEAFTGIGQPVEGGHLTIDDGALVFVPTAP